jgi:hypothetical protein
MKKKIYFDCTKKILIVKFYFSISDHFLKNLEGSEEKILLALTGFQTNLPPHLSKPLLVSGLAIILSLP